MREELATIAVVCLCLIVSVTHAETAEEAFQSTFGAEADKVAKTPSKEDDVGFAAKLLEAAQTVTDQPEFQVLLCEKACEYAMSRPTGFPTAQRSVALWRQLKPRQQQKARKKMLELCERLYRDCRGEDKRVAGSCLIEALLAEGDAQLGAGKIVEALRLYKQAAGVAQATRCPWGFCVDQRIAAARDQQGVQRTLDRLEKALENRPTDKGIARQLAMLHLTGKDDPNAALRLWGSRGLEEKFLANLDLACREATGLGPEEYRKLRDFYRSLAPKAGRFGAIRMLQRSKGYAQDSLAAHTGKDAELLQADRALDQINAELARACSAVNGGWVDLLHIIRPEKDVIRGGKDWRFAEAGLVSPCAWLDWLMVPYLPPAEYDLRASFTRHSGKQMLAFFCTFGQKQFAFLVSESENTLCGLERIGGRRVRPDNPSTRKLSVQNGRRYTVLIQVRREGIGVSLDGRRIIEHRTNGSDLMLPPTWPDKQPPGLVIAAWRSRVVYHSLCVKDVNGRGTFVDHPKPQEKD